MKPAPITIEEKDGKTIQASYQRIYLRCPNCDSSKLGFEKKGIQPSQENETKYRCTECGKIYFIKIVPIDGTTHAKSASYVEITYRSEEHGPSQYPF